MKLTRQHTYMAGIKDFIEDESFGSDSDIFEETPKLQKRHTITQMGGDKSRFEDLLPKEKNSGMFEAFINELNQH